MVPWSTLVVPVHLWTDAPKAASCMSGPGGADIRLVFHMVSNVR